MGAARVARAALAGAALAALAAAPRTAADEPRPWYLPDHAKLQLAGNIGFLSPGAGYALERRLEGDVFLGWVPEAVGGDDIFSLTGKLTFAPWSIDSGPWSFHPFTAALQLTYTFGDEYYVISEDLFVPTALRSGVALGAAAGRLLGGRRVGIYAELVALDLALGYWLGNPSALGPGDVFSVAVGARLDL